MGKYLYKHKDTYRLRCPYDLDTGEYIRDSYGNLVTDDIYIECKTYQGRDEHDMIYDYDSSSGTLEAFFYSKQRGKDVLDQLDKNIYFDVDENDKELWFHFKNKDIDKVARLMGAKPAFKGSSTPFSNKYLPEYKEKMRKKRELMQQYNTYEMPKGYWDEMKTELLPELARQHSKKINEILEMCYEGFSKHKGKDFVAEAEKEKYRINHYLGKLGLWDEFVEFVRGMC